MGHEIIRVTTDPEQVNQRMQELLDGDDTPTLCFLYDQRDGCWRATAMWDDNDGINFAVDAHTEMLLTGMHNALRLAAMEVDES